MLNKKAFSLIELLVVVLIIGILSAVAFPYYRAAVDKTRASESLTILRSLKTSMDFYILKNGVMATNFGQLGGEIGKNCKAARCVHGNFTYSFSSSPQGAIVAYFTTGNVTTGKGGTPYLAYIFNASTWKNNRKNGDIICQDRGVGRWSAMCMALGGEETTSSTSSGKEYLLEF